VLVVAQGAAEANVVGIAAVAALEKEVGLADSERFGFDLLAKQIDVGGGAQLEDAFLGDGEHAAAAATGIIDARDEMFAGKHRFVGRGEQVDHQANDFAWGEVLAGVLVERLVELTNQLLEDIAHVEVGDALGVQIDVLEALQHLEQQSVLVELADGVVEVEALQHLAHVGGEAVEVDAQVAGQAGEVGEQAIEVERRGVVEGKARRLAQLRVGVSVTFVGRK
jgi:hypothetical protein